MSTVVSQKMGLKEGLRSILVNAPDGILETIAAPGLDMARSLRGEFDYIHFFVKSQNQMDKRFPKLREHLKPTGKLWVSWPKSGQLGTDLTIKSVIKIGYDHGLVESTTLSVDDTWSAIKFTHPKKGKVYNNSYGKLKDHAA
jgi:hypothetical protein